VVGNGNVALDVARILTSDPEALAQTDIADHALQQLRTSQVRDVVVVGRRGPLEAAFTIKELLGLADAGDVDLVVQPEEMPLRDDQTSGVGGPESSMERYKVDLMNEYGTRTPESQRRITLRFFASPEEITGGDRVESVQFQRNVLVVEEGRVVARPSGKREQLDCGLVFRAVGYRGGMIDDLPFDEQRGVVPNAKGRVIDPTTDEFLEGLYVAGWIKRGPTGVIGTNKKCACETVTALLADFAMGRLPTPTDMSDVADVLPDHLGLEAWKLIDEHEQVAGKEQRRPRVKLVEMAALLEVARSRD
jgi:ferredoxin--NADP+ reductase